MCSPKHLSPLKLHPLLQKVRRKRLIRTAVYRQRNDMVLRILEKKTGQRFQPYRQRIIWVQYSDDGVVREVLDMIDHERDDPCWPSVS